jgi:hypothetical protein
MEKHDEGGVGAELTRLLSGENRKSRWLLGGMIGTAMVATWLAPRLGWRVPRLRLQPLLKASRQWAYAAQTTNTPATLNCNVWS